MSKGSSDLKKLQKLWYAKLAKKGFEDIEDTDSPNEYLKRWDGSWFRTRFQTKNLNGKAEFDGTRFGAKQDYFNLAADLLNTEQSWTRKERKIWELHSQGLSLREIQSATKVHYSSVHAIVKRFRKQICK